MGPARTEPLPQNIRYLTLPAVSIGLSLLCFYTRLLRADLLEQMQGEDYVVTARAKGVRPWRVSLVTPCATRCSG